MLAAPVAVFFLLRVRPMAPVDMIDPAYHTAFIVHPHDLFRRYGAYLDTDANSREAARVGWIVPARLAYLAFGLLPGFYVMRYALALVAVVPVYVLLRRIAGPGAGALGVLVVLTCPVVLTAWGTDYPDGAAISYLAGALACLGVRSIGGRRWWAAAAGVLLALALWSHLAAALLAGATVLCFVLVRAWSGRRHLVGDLAALVGAAAVCTVVLVPLSAVLIGRANFLSATLATFSVAGNADTIRQSHSASWRWAPYRAYLLVPPAVIGVWVAATVGRLRRMVPVDMLVGLTAVVQLVIFAYLQFVARSWTLQDYFFSSQLWGAVSVTLTLVLVRIARPLFLRAATAWIPAVVVVLTVICYEHVPRVPRFGWFPAGVVVAAAVVALGVAARVRGRGPAWGAVAAALVFAGVGVLTVAPSPRHGHLRDTARIVYPQAPYAAALGGSGTYDLDQYRVAAALPAFVGPARYPGELLVYWFLRADRPYLLEPLGMYRGDNGFAMWHLPRLSALGLRRLAALHPGQVLLLSSTGRWFPTAVAALRTDDPHVVRAGVIASGSYRIHAWLVDLDAFGHRT